MKNTYHLGYRAVAYILLVVLLLQSCGNFINPIGPHVPREKTHLSSIGEYTEGQAVSHLLPELDKRESTLHNTTEKEAIVEYHQPGGIVLASEPAKSTKERPLHVEQVSRENGTGIILSVSKHLTGHTPSNSNRNMVPHAIQAKIGHKTTHKASSIKEPALSKPRHHDDIVGQQASSLQHNTFIVKGGCLVRFVQSIDGKWQAEVLEKIGSLSRKHILSLYFEPGLSLSQITQNTPIHVILPKASIHQPGYVYVGNMGLKGGMIRDDEQDDIPNECFCPITQEIMEDPVIAQDGHTYERSAIQSWFDRGKRISPKTGARLLSTELTPNHSMRSLIRDLKEQMPVLARHQLERLNIEAAIRLREEELQEQFAQKGTLLEKEIEARLILEREIEQGQKEKQKKEIEESSVIEEKPVREEEFVTIEGANQCYMLGERYRQGEVGKYYQEACKWYQKAIEQDDKYRAAVEGLFRNPIFWPYLKDTQVHTLDLARCNIDDAGAAALAVALPGSQVHTLKLGSNKRDRGLNGIGNKGARALAAVLPNTQVHTLKLGNNKIGNKGVRFLAAALQNTQVHTLHLNINSIGDEGARALAAALPNSKIKILNLHSNKIGNKGARALAKVLPNTQVHTLDVGGNILWDVGVEYLAKALQDSQVHTLTLGSTSIRSAGVKSLSRVLPNTQVHTLYLGGTEIGNEGVRALAEALPNTKVTTLDLSCSSITSVGVGDLARVLPKTQVTTLNLEGNCIDFQRIHYLEEALPDSQVKKLYLTVSNIYGAGALIGWDIARSLVRRFPHIKWRFKS